MLGVLVGLMTLAPEGEDRGEAAATLSLSCGTDNRGNSYLLDRMLTTKYPLGVILMELAHQMRRRRLVLRAHWLPRDQNEEADALTNFDYSHFDMGKRIEVDLDKLDFKVLPDLFACGESFHAELKSKREEEKARVQTRRDRAEGKRRKSDGLGPW